MNVYFSNVVLVAEDPLEVHIQVHCKTFRLRFFNLPFSIFSCSLFSDFIFVFFTSKFSVYDQFKLISLNQTKQNEMRIEKVNVALRAKLTEEIKENTIKVKVSFIHLRKLQNVNVLILNERISTSMKHFSNWLNACPHFMVHSQPVMSVLKYLLLSVKQHR